MEYKITLENTAPKWNDNAIGADPNHDSKQSSGEVERLVRQGLEKFLACTMSAGDSDAAVKLHTHWKKYGNRPISVTVKKGIHQRNSDAHITVATSETYAEDRRATTHTLHVCLTLIDEGRSSY